MLPNVTTQLQVESLIKLNQYNIARPTIPKIGYNQILSTIKANSFNLSRPLVWLWATTTDCATCIIHNILYYHMGKISQALF